MLAGEVDAPLRRDYVLVQKRFLPRLEEGERPARVRILVPDLGVARFELLVYLRVDLGDVL